MILKKFALKIIKVYQYISLAFGMKCRYYPTCSNYAIWEFETDKFLYAFLKTIFRVLRCNQLFRGGIDYPVIKKEFTPVYAKKRVKYWLIPKGDNKFIVIRNLE